MTYSVSNTVSTAPAPNPAQLIGQERQKFASFPIDEMHQFIEGAVEKSNQVLSIYQDLERNPVLNSTFHEYDNSKAQNRELTALRINQLARYRERESASQFFRRLNLITVYDPSLGIRISINLGLFLNCIKGNGTDEQYNFWANTKEAGTIKQLYGCFGMTELGHGSNVAGCETTATFDKEADEFVINTPHIGATKWWIGGAAHSATHTVCYARLIVDGKDYGVKTFIVPLRDSNHDLMPGINIGDIGSKMGREGVDNGWIQFSNVRIPRFFMLQKWCKVSRDGKVDLPPLEQVSYISLLGGRVFMATDSYRICARFTTIALRYAVGRRQFKSKGQQQETQLLDYPLHQRRVLPFLALTYAMAIGTNKLELEHSQILEDLEAAVKQNNEAGIKRSLAKTKALFNDSGSLKATLTWLAADCIDQCRQACGGAGYSSYNGFGKSYNDWVVQCTWEGDNSVLSMSCGKTIITHVKNILQKKGEAQDSFAFLNKAEELNSITDPILSSESDLKDWNKVLYAVEALIVKLAYTSIKLLETNGDNLDDVGFQRVVLSKLRCHQYLLSSLIEQYHKASPELQKYLSTVTTVYFYTSIIEPYAADLFQYNLLSKNLRADLTLRLIPTELKSIRELAIPLTDSFKQPDNLLHSAIGKFNGDIYENYFNAVKDTNHNLQQKAPYHDALDAMLNRKSLAERERFERSSEVANILSK